MKLNISFADKCYLKLKEVPMGKITTYKELAHAINSKAYRAVGTAMNKNPFAPEIPCHRVVNSNGKVGKFASGTENKIKILKKEGIQINKGKIEDFENKLYKFS
ncbi:MAG: methylated-DNA-[protein]-cysteine S-methyltransferase [archaeon GW2011_AR13]|nr:MAG: methylated-DNA-[protein]-cysteine S-methyltransferase [archaeon GW2011_AR13]